MNDQFESLYAYLKRIDDLDWLDAKVSYYCGTDCLYVYFTKDMSVRRFWCPVSNGLYIGVSMDNEKLITGLMIEGFMGTFIGSEYGRRAIEEWFRNVSDQ